MAGATNISAIAALTSNASTTPKVTLTKPAQIKQNRLADEVGNEGSLAIEAGSEYLHS